MIDPTSEARKCREATSSYHGFPVLWDLIYHTTFRQSFRITVEALSFNTQHKDTDCKKDTGSRLQGTATMQAMPDSRQQSFEEIYGPPENFLEIEVGFYFCQPCAGVPASSPTSHSPTPTNTPPPGEEPTYARHGPQHVHRLRDRLQNQHPRVQAPP